MGMFGSITSRCVQPFYKWKSDSKRRLQQSSQLFDHIFLPQSDLSDTPEPLFLHLAVPKRAGTGREQRSFEEMPKMVFTNFDRAATPSLLLHRASLHS